MIPACWSRYEGIRQVAARVDRYVGHLDSAANDAGKAKSRPGDEDGQATERSRCLPAAMVARSEGLEPPTF